MFYLRREREERARGRSEDAALEAAAATSGRAVLISGITVMIAMAGMYLGGAATFSSFATGTILVVAISMIGSLTVLPAVLSKLGDRVNKGRVPFLKPERRTGEPRVWGWVLDRVLKRPKLSLAVATALMVVLALPALHIHTADSGVDGLPRSLAVMQTYDRMQAAFPGEQFTRQHRRPGRRRDLPRLPAGGRPGASDRTRLQAAAGAGDGRRQQGQGHDGRARAAGRLGHRRQVGRRARPAARRRGPGHDRRHRRCGAGRRERLHGRLGGLQRPDEAAHLVRARLRLRRWPSCCCW